MPMRRRVRGSVILEFTLVGIPLLFLLVSIFEISRGMWAYETLSSAVNVGARYASLHGQGCSSGGFSCAVTVGDLAGKIAAAAPGIPASAMSVTLSSAASGTVTCSPLGSCLSDTTAWPPSTFQDNAPGKEIVVTGQYTFRSALAMVAPGSGSTSFAATTFAVQSRQVIQF